MATLDHLSGGRAAWNIVTSFQDAEARNFGRDGAASRARNATTAPTSSWRSPASCGIRWGDDALVRDPAAPLFADPAKVRRVDHDGRWFKVRGPLNVSRSPQGRPVFLQAGASDRGRDFAARWAEVVFVTHPAADAARDSATTCGRAPNGSAAIPTTSRCCPASRRWSPRPQRRPRTAARCWRAWRIPQAGLSTLSYHLDIDLSQFPQDEVLPAMDVPGVQGHYREVAEMTRRSGVSLREIGRRYGAGRMPAGFTGTPAHSPTAWRAGSPPGRATGSCCRCRTCRAGWRISRGWRCRSCSGAACSAHGYEGSTLREHLGLARPAA